MNIITKIVNKIDHIVHQPPRHGAKAGAFSEDFWKHRDETNSTVDGFWATRHSGSRTAIAKAVASLGGKRVLEVGAHCGVNMWAIGQQRPFDWIVGVDFSEHVVNQGQKLLAEHLNQPHSLQLAHSSAIPFPQNAFDIVLASVTLVCIGPDKIMETLREMIRVSSRYIVLAEPHTDDHNLATAAGQIDPYPNTTYWIRNYAGLIAKLAPGSREVSLTMLPDADCLGHLNSVQVIELAK